MEEKKTTKVSLSTFFLVITIIALGVMGYFIYKISNDKSIEEKKSAELQSQVNSLNGTVSELQEKIDTISNSTNLNTTVAQNNNTNSNEINKNTTNNANNEIFTEAQVKQAASDYLELLANANCGIPLDTLNKKGKINYDSSKSTINTTSGEVTTNVKFSDYKKAMLNYVTESEFDRNWTSKIYLKEDSNGYLVHFQGGGALIVYIVNSVSKIDDKTFTAQTISMLEHDATTKTNEDFTFTVKSYNGRCVIDSCK